MNNSWATKTREEKKKLEIFLLHRQQHRKKRRQSVSCKHKKKIVVKVFHSSWKNNKIPSWKFFSRTFALLHLTLRRWWKLYWFPQGLFIETASGGVCELSLLGVEWCNFIMNAFIDFIREQTLETHIHTLLFIITKLWIHGHLFNQPLLSHWIGGVSTQ